MSRSQFVRNTLAAIQMQLHPSSDSNHLQTSFPDVYDDSQSLRSFPLTGSGQGSSSSSAGGSDGSGIDTVIRSKRSDSITSWNSISRETILSSPALSLAASQATTPIIGSESTPNVQNGGDLKTSTNSIPTSSPVYGRAWETNMENLLKVCFRWLTSCCRVK